jgi:twinkle protein
VIVPHIQVSEEVEALYRTGGLPKGSPVGWPSVDKLYSVGMGQWTLITGQPHSGKSEWLDAVLVNLAKSEDWMFVIYSPENWPLALHHSKIIEKYVGKPFGPGPTERMTIEEVQDAEEWMRGKFRFAKPEQPDIFSILDEACGIPLSGSKLGVVIDPWNQLQHYRPASMSETEYISQTLSACIDIVRRANCHLWLVAHPHKMIRGKDGTLPVPTPNDVSGSSHWWAKADNCITVHRDQVERSQEVEIHVQKVRFKHMGHIGLATLRYDLVTGRYFDQTPTPAYDYKRRASGEREPGED